MKKKKERLDPFAKYQKYISIFDPPSLVTAIQRGESPST